MALQCFALRAASTSCFRRRFQKKVLRGQIWNLEFCLRACSEGLGSETWWFISLANLQSCLKNVKHPHYRLTYPVMFWILNLKNTHWQGVGRLAKGVTLLCFSKPAICNWLAFIFTDFSLFSCHAKICAASPKHLPASSCSFLFLAVNEMCVLHVPPPLSGFWGKEAQPPLPGTCKIEHPFPLILLLYSV